MNVYIEYVIADNFSVDFLLLWAAAVTLKLPFKWWRLSLGAFVGALCAVVSVFVHNWIVYPIKLLCLVAMCCAAIGLGKKLLWYILLVLTYTFVLGGAVVAVFHLFKISYVTENGEFYNLNVPLFVYVAALFFTAFLTYSVAFYVNSARKAATYLTQAKVQLNNGVCAVVSAFCDSGNSLTFNNLPVCFVTKKFSGFSRYFAEQTLLGKTCKIDVATVAGRQSVSAVPAVLEAHGQRRQVYLALPAAKCSTAYNVILSNEFCAETTATTCK